jgi:hypothetical protein
VLLVREISHLRAEQTFTKLPNAALLNKRPKSRMNKSSGANLEVDLNFGALFHGRVTHPGG